MLADMDSEKPPNVSADSLVVARLFEAAIELARLPADGGAHCGSGIGGWPTSHPSQDRDRGAPHLAFEMWVSALPANNLRLNITRPLTAQAPWA
jgi:hypothetical protein